MDEILQFDPNMPSQTHAFAWALVEALKSAEIDVRLLSCAPVSNYPRNPKILFRGKPFRFNCVSGESLAFVNLFALKHLSRFIGCLRRGTKLIRRWKPDILMIHGVHTPFLLYGVLSRRFAESKLVVIITDPPGVVLPSDRVLVRALKRLDAQLVRWALRSVDGVVVLTAALASDFAPDKPSLLMEGIFRDGIGPKAPSHTGSKFRVLYAGGLSESYGVDRLVKAIQTLPTDRVRFAAYGKGSLKSWINEESTIDQRIARVQFAKREKVLEKYATADLLVQPRPVDQAFTRYSFPSKLLEYLGSGTPVLSTRLPGIPPEYEPYVYWIDDDTVEGIGHSLRAVMAIPADLRAAKGRAAAGFAAETRSSFAQGARLRSFLVGLLRSL